MGPLEEGVGMQIEKLSKEPKGSKIPWQFLSRLQIHNDFLEQLS